MISDEDYLRVFGAQRELGVAYIQQAVKMSPVLESRETLVKLAVEEARVPARSVMLKLDPYGSQHAVIPGLALSDDRNNERAITSSSHARKTA